VKTIVSLNRSWIPRVGIILSLLIFSSLSLKANSGSWTPTGGGFWTNKANWSGANYPNGQTETATLGNTITADSTITLDNNIRISTLTINDDNRYSITGAGTLTISSASKGTVNQDGTGGITINSNVDNFGNPLTLQGTGTGSLIIGGTLSGAGLVSKQGSHTAILSGANTYSGVTAVGGGILVASANNALGSTAGGTTVSNGASLAFSNNVAYTTAEAVTLFGAGVGGIGALNNMSGANSFDGAVTLGAASTIGTTVGTLTLNGAIANGGFLLTTTNLGGTTLTVNGVISGTGGLTKAGTGTTVLSGASANTFSGATIVNGGILELNKSGALGSTSAITLNSGGTLLFTGNNSMNRVGDTVGLTLNGGTLRPNDMPETMGTLTLTANSTIDLSDDGINSDLTFSGGSWTSGVLIISNWVGNATVSGTGDRVFFSSPVSSTLLSQIQFAGIWGQGAIRLGTGEIVPVPEPSTVLTSVALLSLMGSLRYSCFLRSRKKLPK
jgi:autotransporter-associated beta strand protein